MDVFSIPVKEPHPKDDPKRNREELKMTVISKTNNIYALADNVLVLDAELQSISYHSLSPEELATCAWQGRSWTFLESSLALRMYRDGPCQFESLWREMEKARERILRAKWSTRGCMLLNLYDMAFLKIRRPAVGELLGKNAHKRYVRFSEIWMSLSSCWTKKLDEIFLILANILGFGDINNVHRDERMKTLLLSHEYLPMDLFCVKNIPTLTPTPGDYFGWVPRGHPRGLSNRWTRQNITETYVGKNV